jgi:hypothetical protein
MTNRFSDKGDFSATMAEKKAATMQVSTKEVSSSEVLAKESEMDDADRVLMDLGYQPVRWASLSPSVHDITHHLRFQLLIHGAVS